jgi:hypothetical protein
MSDLDPSPRLQFSTRWLLAAVAVVALLLGAGVVAGGLLDAFLLRPAVTLFIPTCLLVVALHSKGEVRASAIGGLVPYAWMLADVFPGVGTWGVSGGRLWIALMVVACGLIGKLTYRWLDRNGLLR